MTYYLAKLFLYIGLAFMTLARWLNPKVTP